MRDPVVLEAIHDLLTQRRKLFYDILDLIPFATLAEFLAHRFGISLEELDPPGLEALTGAELLGRKKGA